MTSLFIQTVPSSTVSLPERILSRVDLPEPLRAMRAILSPSEIWNDILVKSGFMP